MRTSIIILVIILCAKSAQAQQYGRVNYISPDNKLEANLIPVCIQGLGFNEDRIEIRNNAGKLIATKNYSSTDHEHGYGVIFAAWTPDSKYFVYSLASSGGHSAWHFPTNVFVRSKSKIFSLDDSIKHPLVKPQFILTSPNHFYSERLSGEGYDNPNVPINLDLKNVIWTEEK